VLAPHTHSRGHRQSAVASRPASSQSAWRAAAHRL